MKTWIFANQTLATVIGLLLLAILIYVAVKLVQKFSAPKNIRVVEEPPTVYETVISPAPRPAFSVRTSSVGSGGAMAGAGARVSGGGVKH